MQINKDCRHFRGDRPCAFHKQEGVHCEKCRFYDPIKERILIIKLGAIGDVIRTTPILHRLKKEYPQSEITWLSHTPEILPSIVDKRLRFDIGGVLPLMADSFDLLLNLDKDPESISLTRMIPAKQKHGFTQERGKCVPVDALAAHKWQTGIYDDLSQQNTKSYLEEIFEICGYEFQGERYILENNVNRKWDMPSSRPLIGLNTGCGGRWLSRLWPDEYWIDLGQMILKKNFGVLLLGGAEEDQKNQNLAKKCGAVYLGYYPLQEFISLVDQCDIIVTQVTMALHIAIGLRKHVVVMNNIFNRHEFELYGLGEVVEPHEPCGCYYSPMCPHESMKSILPEEVLQIIERQVRKTVK